MKTKFAACAGLFLASQSLFAQLPSVGYSFTFGIGAHTTALVLDTNDNVYIAGNTTATNFPTLNGFQSKFTGSQDAFVAKFSSNGVLIFSTLLGGSGAQSAQGIALDTNGNIYVTGYTSSTNFPVTNALQSANAGGYDAFVTELNAAGNGLIFSTYLGGSGFDAATGIALDTSGSPTITGYTQSSNFPVASALQSSYAGNGDAFVTKLAPGGKPLVFSTYLGGDDSENNGTSFDIDPVANLGDVLANLGGAVAVDLTGNTYVTGWTYSTNFPVTNAFQSSNAVYSPGSYSTPFVTEIDPSGHLVYSTYFGGGFNNTSRAIGVDASGDVYFAGSWYGYDLPVTNSVQSSFAGSFGFTSGANGAPGDGFIAGFDPTGTNLIFCSYLGGVGDEQINGMYVRPDGALAVSGWTDSPFFPLRNATQPVGYQGFFASNNGGIHWTATQTGIFPGPIFAIGVDPFNAANIYLLGNGGVFQSTNTGATWHLANSFNTSAALGSSQEQIAFDPVHRGVVYVGGYDGVFKTTNSGSTWTGVNTGLPSSPSVQALAVDPNAPNWIYAGTQDGLFQSTNGGTSWNSLSNLTSFYVTAVLVDPLNSSNIYAGLDFFGPYLYLSSDRGVTWTPLTSISNNLPVEAIVANPANPAMICVLAGSSSTGATLYMTTNRAATWSQILTASNQNLTTIAVAPPPSPALSIALSPSNAVLSWPGSFSGFGIQTTPHLKPSQWQAVTQNAQSVGGNYATTIPIGAATAFYRLAYTNAAPRPPALYVGTDQTGGQGLLRSTDGGVTWQAIGLAGQTVNAVAASPSNPSTVYAGLAAGYDAFVATIAPPTQFSPGRFMYYSSYIGGSGADQGNAIAMDFSTAYVAGSTLSPDFPKVGLSHAQRDLDPEPTQQTEAAWAHELDQAMDCPTNSVYYIQMIAGAHKYSEEFWNLKKAGIRVTGSLPPGLSVDMTSGGPVISEAVISGTPTQAGSYSWTATYFYQGCVWSFTYNITVSP